MPKKLPGNFSDILPPLIKVAIITALLNNFFHDICETMTIHDYYQQTTREIEVSVLAEFLEDHSDPDHHQFVWAYHVRIENKGHETVQLLTRHWKIMDGVGGQQEVLGDGVIGEQPVLTPGQVFEYSSGTPLATPSGIMSGSYGMETGDGEAFDVKIPMFSLDSPHQSIAVN